MQQKGFAVHKGVKYQYGCDGMFLHMTQGFQLFDKRQLGKGDMHSVFVTLENASDFGECYDLVCVMHTTDPDKSKWSACDEL